MCIRDRSTLAAERIAGLLHMTNTLCEYIITRAAIYMQIHINLWNSDISVSYTHLDVYKRQGLVHTAVLFL